METDVGDWNTLKQRMFATAGSKIWSQGVQLHRDERVRLRSSSPTEAELEVSPPARPTTYAVSLNCQDDEWDCDCTSRERLCAHAVAAILLARHHMAPANRLTDSAMVNSQSPVIMSATKAAGSKAARPARVKIAVS